MKAEHRIQEKHQLQVQAIAIGKRDKSRITGSEYFFPVLRKSQDVNT